MLRTLYGASAPSPTSAIVTRWASDPLARGSYSFLPKGALPADRTKWVVRCALQDCDAAQQCVEMVIVGGWVPG